MPWSAATGLCARIINTRGDMGWDVPIVGHPALMALPIRALLNKPDYWKDVFAAGYTRTTYADGKLPPRTQKLVDEIKPALGGFGSTVGAVVGGLALGVLGAFATYLFGGAFQQTIAVGLLMVVLLIKPEGLFGARGMRPV